MTSNQLTYWRNQEEVRANKAREAETQRHNVITEREAKRHNLTTENIDTISNELKSRGYDIQQQSQILDLWDMWSKYGTFDVNQIPPEIRTKFYETLGIEPTNQMYYTDQDATQFNQFWREIGDFMKDVSGIIKNISSLF